jgi:hypothetical protein
MGTTEQYYIFRELMERLEIRSELKSDLIDLFSMLQKQFAKMKKTETGSQFSTSTFTEFFNFLAFW